MPESPLEKERMNRRTFVLGAPTLAAATVGSVAVASASTEDRDAVPMTATVAAHVSDDTIEAIPYGWDVHVRVRVTADAKLNRRGGVPAKLGDYAIGEVVSIDPAYPAEDVHTALERVLTDRRLTARRIQPCIVGTRAGT
jgi:hypothetical protein